MLARTVTAGHGGRPGVVEAFRGSDFRRVAGELHTGTHVPPQMAALRVERRARSPADGAPSSRSALALHWRSCPKLVNMPSLIRR